MDVCTPRRWASTSTFPQSRSLKAKRAAIRPIVDGLRHRFRISVAEVDHQDQWQRADDRGGGGRRERRAGPGAARRRRAVRRRRARRRAARHRDRRGSRPEERVVAQHGSARAYPRMARVNEVVREVDRRRARAAVRPAPRARHRHGRRRERRPAPRDRLLFRARADRSSRGAERPVTVTTGSDEHPGRPRSDALAGRGAAPARRARAPGPHEVRPRAHVPRGSRDRRRASASRQIIRELHDDEPRTPSRGGPG